MSRKLSRVFTWVMTLMLLCSPACAVRPVRPVPDVPPDVTPLIESTVQVEHMTLVVGDDGRVYPRGGSGSGVVVMVRPNKTYIVTASHVCATPDRVFKIQAHELRVNRFDGRTHRAQVVRSDALGDVCLLSVEGAFGRGIRLSETSPPVGAPVVFCGGPMGKFGKGLAVVQDARYAGTMDEGERRRVVLSSNTAPGMSGGGVFWRGELVGIVTAVSIPFGTPVYAADLQSLRALLSESPGMP